MARNDADETGGTESNNTGIESQSPGNPGETGIAESGTTGGADPAAAAAPRKRGRPPGSTKRSGGDIPRADSGKPKPPEKRPKLALDRDKLGRQLVGIHAMAALALKQPIISITEQQGEDLGGALVDIAEFYGLTASKQTMLWINLAGTAAMIYGPKIYTIAKMPKQPKQSAQNVTAPGNASVLNFGGAVP